jgi:hypothetical protein
MLRIVSSRSTPQVLGHGRLRHTQLTLDFADRLL